MDMPTNRRDQIVMGLSICALILLVANIATFVKQRFLDSETEVHHSYVISGTSPNAIAVFSGQGHGHEHEHEWHVEHIDGNQVWSVGDDIDRELAQLSAELEAKLSHDLMRAREAYSRAEDEGRRHRKRARYKWRMHGDHVDGEHAVEVDALIEEARKAALEIEMNLGLDEMPRLHLESLDGEVEVVESQDEAGRHRYRIVVKPDSDNR